MTSTGDILSLYDTWAPQYDEMPNPTKALSRQVLARLLPEVQEKRVLEAGCGSGEVLAALSNAARVVIGLDGSREMLRLARARIGTANAMLLQCDLTHPWPVAAAVFDLVVIALVLEHIAELQPVFAEACRVLKPLGELAVVELHPVRQRRGVRARFVEPKTGRQHRIPAAVHSEQEFEQAARGAGFRNVKLQDWFDEKNREEPRLISLRARRGGV